MKELLIKYSPDDIKDTVCRLAEEISTFYDRKDLLVIAILKGSFIFLADLVRNLNIPAEIEFISLSSYREGIESSGTVRLNMEPLMPLAGRDILLVEDIVDTGLTTRFAIDYLKNKKPGSINLCALLDKAARRRTEIEIKFLGYSIPDEFVVGYGLDCNEKYRSLPGLYVLGGK